MKLRELVIKRYEPFLLFLALPYIAWQIRKCTKELEKKLLFVDSHYGSY